MPVRYDIAAQVPQIGAGQDPMNMLAQYQMLGYRQQQNALAQMQMQKLQQELQAQQAIRGMAGGLNMSDPRVINQIWAQDPEFARQIYASQLAGQRERRMAEQAAASTENIRAEQALRERRYGEIDLPKSQLEAERERRLAEQAAASAENIRAEQALRQRKFEELDLPKMGLEKQKLGAEARKEELAGRKLEFEINKEALDRDAKSLEKLENLGAKVFNNNGRGYSEFRQMAIKQHPEFENMLSSEYDAEALAGFVSNAASTREQLKSASDYEYREVKDASGATRIVAIPKKSPQAGAIPVKGTEGATPADYGFMAGPPDTGLVTRTNPRTGQAELIAPNQPIMRPPEGKINARANVGGEVAPAAEGALIPSEIRPTAEAPVGSAAYNNKRFATEALDAVGFNSQTGEDKISNLIKKSTSGGLDVAGAGLRGFFGKATPGMEAIGQIKPIVKDIILKKLNGKLGAGISNEDRAFIEGAIGNLDDPSIPANQRLASWNSAKQILMKYANTGQPAAGAPGNRPSLNEIFK
jgi:hypothetical protein